MFVFLSLLLVKHIPFSFANIGQAPSQVTQAHNDNDLK